jgi:hypothetical protein
LPIDWSAPAVRKAFGRGRSNSGKLSWSCGDVEVASVGFTWNAASKYIELRYSLNGVARVQRIKVVETTPHFGGMRPWSWCEVSQRRTRILVLTACATSWVARSAAPVTYRRQRERSGLLGGVVALMRRERGRLQRNAVRRLRRRERASARGA